MSATLAEPGTVFESVSVWPRYPCLYEINTWVWLSELRQKYGKNVDLSSVPSSEWNAIAAFGFDAVWLMGVWERSCAGIAIANQDKVKEAGGKKVTITGKMEGETITVESLKM